MRDMDAAYVTALACLPGMSPLYLPRLLKLAGGAESLWGILRKGGRRPSALVGEEKARRWAVECRETRPDRVLGDMEDRGIRVVLPGGEAYPERLEAIYDPPPLLFVRGKTPPAEAPFVAVVGSRDASDYGRWTAEDIGRELALEGIVVVSGAAYGVDGRAHFGCLKAGGFTVAVLGCGLERVYPAGHAELLGRVGREGCLLSEYPPEDGPLPWKFPHRNRIIAGLSHAVVVVEASRKSGALITADMALEEGREVMAVPGPITSPLSRGTNTLIQKGAKLVTCVEDILEELPSGPPRKRDHDQAPYNCVDGAVSVKLSENAEAVLEVLEQGPMSLDGLSAAMGEAAGGILVCLTKLSLLGLVAEEAGGRYRRLGRENGEKKQK